MLKLERDHGLKTNFCQEICRALFKTAVKILISVLSSKILTVYLVTCKKKCNITNEEFRFLTMGLATKLKSVKLHKSLMSSLDVLF